MKLLRRMRLEDASRIVAVVLYVSLSAFSQTSQKAIVWSNDPLSRYARSTTTEVQSQLNNVEIETISVNGKPVTIGQLFDADEDWIKMITARVKNVSEERIATLQITFAFPEADPGSPEWIICYGCAQTEKEKGVRPGEIVELKGRDDMYQWVKKSLSEKGSFSRIRWAQIRTMFVTTANGKTSFSACVKTLDHSSACPAIRRL
jgi:hypothetical protein